MRTLSLLLCLSVSLFVAAQNYTVSGHVVDASQTDEALIGANVLYASGQGVVADLDGYYSFDLPKGEHTLTFSYVGFTTVTKTINLNSNLTLDVKLESSMMMKEVMVVADVAIARETPVAFSTLSPKTLEENIAAQDIPMVLNATPGVYATQEGGGDGDAEVTIRGFESRNVGVLLDGVPVNDMESGHVYWSNWFGLDAVTRSMQVQRGLGASKLALPSVGGTINIVTKGLDAKKGGSYKQEVGSDGYLRSSLGYSTGLLNNGWAFSAAVSYKQGNGWVDELYSKGFFYYAKVDKRMGNHSLSLSAYGAPQEHAQRSYKQPIATYDSAYAVEQGVKLDYAQATTPEEIAEVETNRANGVDMGLRYNQHWGYLAETKDNPNAKAEPFNERINFYHKPQITLKDTWKINEQLFMSNIAYVSIGHGGGSSDFSTLSPQGDDRLKNYQEVYDKNINNPTTSYASADQKAATNFLEASMNDHVWYGLLSTLSYDYSENLSISGGIDLRSYNGTHYNMVYDLIGADYYAAPITDVSLVDPNAAHPYSAFVLEEGDKFDYYTDGYVRWGGAFAQLEYKNDKVATFLNLTGARTSYSQTAHFFGLDEAIVQKNTGWNSFMGMTAKGGANYNITETMNAFINLGYLSKAPIFSSVYDYDNNLLTGIENEIVKAIEFGYSYANEIFAANVNTYYTRWENKPMSTSIPDPEGGQERLQANLNGMDAIHKGIELDFILEMTDNLDFQGLMSLGDWRWDTEGQLSLYDKKGNYVGEQSFSAKDIHVSNSAQTQFGGELRWAPFKGAYIKPRFTYFGRYYAQFDVSTLDPTNPNYAYNFDENGDPYDSWETPAYTLVDLHMGYSWKLLDKYRMSARFNVLNVFDKTYVATAQDNDPYSGQNFNTHDARSSSVFMGLGRRYNLSVGVKF